MGIPSDCQLDKVRATDFPSSISYGSCTVHLKAHKRICGQLCLLASRLVSLGREYPLLRREREAQTSPCILGISCGRLVNAFLKFTISHYDSLDLKDQSSSLSSPKIALKTASPALCPSKASFRSASTTTSFGFSSTGTDSSSLIS